VLKDIKRKDTVEQLNSAINHSSCTDSRLQKRENKSAPFYTTLVVFITG